MQHKRTMREALVDYANAAATPRVPCPANVGESAATLEIAWPAALILTGRRPCDVIGAIGGTFYQRR
jgi:hypothetical protein